MSTLTSKKFGKFPGALMRGPVLALALGLAGCMSGILPQNAPEGAQRVALGGVAEIVLPKGFCAHETASKTSSGFALITSCDRLGDGARNGPPFYATVAVGPAGSAAISNQRNEVVARLQDPNSADDLKIFGIAAPIRGVETRRNKIYISAGIDEAREWRGIMDVDDSLVIVTVRVLPDLEATDQDGRKLLAAIMASIFKPRA